MKYAMYKNDPRIQFSIDGRCYEAVGVVDEDECSVKVHEILSRAAMENGGAIGEEDLDFLLSHTRQLPNELKFYCVVTNYCDAKGRFAIFDFDGLQWKLWWDWSFERASACYIVVRCCPC